MKVNIFNYESVGNDFDFKNIDHKTLADAIGSLTLPLSTPEQATELNIIFVDKVEIKRLNKQYRNQDEVTDVLSFDPEVDNLLGEIYICSHIVLERVKELQCTTEMINSKLYRTELLRMIIHGILHLTGFEHTQKYEGPYDVNDDPSRLASPMYQRQEKLLKELLDKLNRVG